MVRPLRPATGGNKAASKAAREVGMLATHLTDDTALPFFVGELEGVGAKVRHRAVVPQDTDEETALTRFRRRSAQLGAERLNGSGTARASDPAHPIVLFKFTSRHDVIPREKSSGSTLHLTLRSCHALK